MSNLNDSIIICGPTPKRKKKAPLKPKKTQKKTTYYECPLKYIQQSSKRWEQARAQERLVRSARNVAKNKKNNLFSPRKNDLIQDSVIVLSDNEDESNEKDENKPKEKETPRKKPMEITLDEKKSIQYLLTSRKTLNGSKDEIESPPRKKFKSIAALSENNSSCLLISDTEDDIEIATINLDGENKAPVSGSVNQKSDDIVVVWSSTKSPPSTQNESKEVTEKEKNDKIFMIDCSPNLNNLSVLECNEEDTNEQSKKKTGKDNAEKEEEKEMADFGLPFSKSGSSIPQTPNKLREIVIDGNNVAMAHTNGKAFSEEGLKLVIDYFKHRGHSVKAFVPQYRRAICHPMLERLYREGTVVFTPSRIVGGKRITPYDDRFILEYATMCGGIVVSLDNYRDLYEEKPEWRDTIKNRILAPTFVGNYVMFPEDPLGRNGPKLQQFLRY